MKTAIRWRIITATLLAVGLRCLPWCSFFLIRSSTVLSQVSSARTHRLELRRLRLIACRPCFAAWRAVDRDSLQRAVRGRPHWGGGLVWRQILEKDSPVTTPVADEPLTAVWLLLGVTLVFSIMRNLPSGIRPAEPVIPVLVENRFRRDPRAAFWHLVALSEAERHADQSRAGVRPGMEEARRRTIMRTFGTKIFRPRSNL